MRRSRPKKPKITRQRVSKKALYSQRLEQHILAHHRVTDFKTPYKLTKKTKKGFRTYYERRFENEMVKFVKDSRKNRWGNKYIFQTKVSINVRGRRLKQYISLPRRKISSLKSAKKYAKQYMDRILKLCDKYMRRGGFKSITIKGMRGEAVKKVSSKVRSSRAHAARGRRKK